jgi:hypothetical protein
MLFLPYKKQYTGIFMIVIIKKNRVSYFIVIKNIDGPAPKFLDKSDISNYFLF